MRLGRSAGVTDTGRRRRRNEDAFVRRPPLFAIADGMGGAQAGEVASRLAAAVLKESVEGETGEARVAELIQEANRRVYQRSNEDAAASGMGTTMTVALVDPSAETLAIGHVGDSRAYLLRGGELEQLTEDHSLVGELLRSGRLAPEDVRTHPQRSVITRALGTDADVDVDTFSVRTEQGDIYLLCSDGLSSMVPDGTIEALLEERRDDLDGAARALVDAANRGGGEDNITVVLFEIADGSVPAEDTAELLLDDTRESVLADDEDTLSGLEAVPAVDTAVVSVEEIQRHLDEQAVDGPAAAEETRRHGAGEGRRWLALIALVLAVAAVVVLVAWGLLR